MRSEPKAVCMLVLDGQGRVLCTSRRGQPEALGLPGGKVEAGEDVEVAAIRELFEETGVLAGPGRPVYADWCRGPDGSECWTETLVPWAVCGEPKSREPGISVGWTSWDALVADDAPFAEYNSKLRAAVESAVIPKTAHRTKLEGPMPQIVGAERLARLPFEPVHVRDIFSYGGMMLAAEFHDEQDRLWVYWWLDLGLSADGIPSTRNLFFRTTASDLQQYRARQIGNREWMLRTPEPVYVVDSCAWTEIAYRCRVEDVPESCLPSPNALHDPTYEDA